MLEERARLLLEGIDPRKMRTQTSGAGVNFHQVYDDRERIYNGVYTKRKWVKNLEREREGEWRGPPLEKWHRGRCIQTVKDVYAVRVERGPIGGNATTVSSSSSSTRREEGGGAPWLAAAAAVGLMVLLVSGSFRGSGLGIGEREGI